MDDKLKAADDMLQQPQINDKQHAMLRDYAWKYFSQHAEQRLKTFNFYVTLAALVVGAFGAFAKDAKDWRPLSVLPFLLTFLAFIFWRFELRNKELVRRGEAALKYLDRLLPVESEGAEPHVLRIFERDDYLSGRTSPSPHKPKWTYSKCFNAVFLVLGIGSFALGLVCLFR